MKSVPGFRRGTHVLQAHEFTLLGAHSPDPQRTRLLGFFFAIRRHIFGNFKINIWLGGKCRKVFILFIIQSRTLQR